MKRYLLAIALVLATVGFAEAGPFEDGLAAYEDGDISEAVKLWRQAAEQGNAKAQYELGVFYADGEGVPQDYAEAAKWFRLAAEQGYADAQFNLGIAYAEGKGVPQDRAEAAGWWRLAAEQSHASAQYGLGFLYEQGEGVPQDTVLAHMWYNLSAAQGNTDAQESRETVAKNMTRDQIATAQKMAWEWKPKQ